MLTKIITIVNIFFLIEIIGANLQIRIDDMGIKASVNEKTNICRNDSVKLVDRYFTSSTFGSNKSKILSQEKKPTNKSVTEIKTVTIIVLKENLISRLL